MLCSRCIRVSLFVAETSEAESPRYLVHLPCRDVYLTCRAQRLFFNICCSNSCDVAHSSTQTAGSRYRNVPLDLHSFKSRPSASVGLLLNNYGIQIPRNIGN